MDKFIDLVSRYYGIDLLGAILALTAAFLVGGGNRYGFLIGFLAGICMGIFAFMAESVFALILNLAMMILNVRGFVKWKKK